MLHQRFARLTRRHDRRVGEIEQTMVAAQDARRRRGFAAARGDVAVGAALALGERYDLHAATGAAQCGDRAAHAHLGIVGMRAEDQDSRVPR
jgi:hypothetical protein